MRTKASVRRIGAFPAKAAVLLIICLVAGIAAGIAVDRFVLPPPAPTEQETVTVDIGALLPLTGGLSSFGKRNQRSLELAIEDINAFAQSTGSKFRFRLKIEDTATDPQTARSKIEALAAQGVKAFIGPMASREVSSVKPFADDRKLVVISQSSTAPALSIAGDFVFRVVPPDTYQGKALARLIWNDGFRKAAVIYSNDAWGVGLFESFRDRFRGLGGTVEGVPYDPNSAEFSSEVAKLADVAGKLGSEVAILIISFEEGIPIIKLAVQNPILSKLKWYGTDGLAKNSKLIEEASSETITIGGLPCTVFVPPGNPLQDNFISKFKSRFGEEPDSYSMNSYDAAWLIALSVMISGEYNGEKIAQVMPLVATRYYGITGTVTLDSSGDRAAGDYGVYQLVRTATGFDWKLVAVYHIDTDTVTRAEG